MINFTVQQTPGVANPAAAAGLLPRLRTGTQAAAELFRQEVAALSPGVGIGPTWTVQRLEGVGVLSWTVSTTHPGARPLDQGATWPNKYPPWGEGTSLANWAEAHGMVPFLVARKLKQSGMRARFYVREAWNNVKDEMIALVQRDGIKAWLESVPTMGSRG